MVINNQSKRESNLELLRLISMYMIVLIHANMYLGHFCHGIGAKVFNGFVNGICNVGVTCFVLISGYFGMKFSIRKLVKMECMMITFSLLELGLVFALFPGKLQGADLLEALVKACLPFVTRKYWFYSAYVCVFLLSGFIEKMIGALEKKEFRNLLAMLLGLFSVLPTLFYFEVIPDNGKGFVQMLIIYLLGRYIRKYKDTKLPTGKALGVLFILWLFNGVSHEIPVQIGGIYHHLCKDNSITNIVIAVIIFYFFKNLKLQAGWINACSKYIFAVFALNNTVVNSLADLFLKDRGCLFSINTLGFMCLVICVLLVEAITLLIGFCRELVFGKVDIIFGKGIEKLFENIKFRKE